MSNSFHIDDDGPPALNDCWNKIGVRGDGSCAELEAHIHCRNCPTYGAAAARLFDRELPDEYRRESTGHFANEKPEAEQDTRSVVIFRLRTEWLALSPGVVRAVSERKPIHSLPHRHNQLLGGLVNVRGELLLSIRLENVLGLEKALEKREDPKRRTHERLLVVSREGGRLVFPVDEIHGVHRYHPRDVKAVPATIAKATATYIQGVLEWGDHCLGILDDQLLFYALDRGLA